jgi:hypothetical protein
MVVSDLKSCGSFSLLAKDDFGFFQRKLVLGIGKFYGKTQ